jgi:zinc protease
MKRTFLAVVLALSGVLAATPAHAQPRAPTETRAERGVPVREVVSPGGIRAWLVSDSTVPMIVLNASWRGGSAGEPARVSGVTGVMADLMTEGAGDLDSAAFNVRVEELNMGLSFSAGWDFIGMGLTTLTENRDAAFALARTALTQPRFDREPLERAKRQLAVSIRQRETNPGFLANLALDQALIPDHVYATRLSAEGVAAIDQAALRNRRNELLTRATLRVTVVGDIDEQTLLPLLDQLFGGLPAGTPPPETSQAQVRDPATVDDMIVRRLPQPQSLVLFAAPGIQDEDPDWIPLQVANFIVGGGGFASRLMKEVREERGLVYGVSTGPNVREASAFVRGQAQTENADVPEAVATIKEVMGQLARNGATQEEVNDAIQYLTGSFPLDLDSNVKIAGTLSSYQQSGRPIDYINQRNGLISRVTLADVNRVLARLYDPANFTFVVVGEPEQATSAAGSP